MANLEIASVTTGIDDRETGSIQTFVIGPKAIHAAEAYVLGLFQLYPTVYFHKATRGAEKLFAELLVRVVTLARDGKCASAGLTDTHPLVRFALSPENLQNVMNLDDSVVAGTLPPMADAADPLISEFAARLRDRKLYKCVDIRSRVGHEFDPEGTGDIERLAKIETCCAKVREKLTEWSEANSNVRQRVLVDEDKRPPYKDAVGWKGPAERINVRTDGGNLVDLKKRSRVVASLADFMLFRVYHDRDDAEAGQVVDRIIDGEVAGCR